TSETITRGTVPRDPERHQTPYDLQQRISERHRPDGKSVGLTVDLLNDACDGPRAGVPAAIWKVVALAATSAGDVGITYAPPGRA
ncbi:hypothetical protein ABZ474_57170, partial [Streptomyces mirabilis]